MHAILVFSLAVATAAATSPAPSPDYAALSYKITSVGKVYKVDDAITIEINVTNVGGCDFLIDPGINASDLVELRVTDSSSALLTPDGVRRASASGKERQTRIKAGTTYSLRAPLSDWGYRISRPGVYTIAAEFPKQSALRPIHAASSWPPPAEQIELKGDTIQIEVR